VTPAFEKFFFQAIKDHVLTDGRVGAAETVWLRQMILTDGQVTERERKLLRELKGEAREAGPEFRALCDECLT
jgi:hypothetical protein